MKNLPLNIRKTITFLLPAITITVGSLFIDTIIFPVQFAAAKKSNAVSIPHTAKRSSKANNLMPNILVTNASYNSPTAEWMQQADNSSDSQTVSQDQSQAGQTETGLRMQLTYPDPGQSVANANTVESVTRSWPYDTSLPEPTASQHVSQPASSISRPPKTSLAKIASPTEAIAQNTQTRHDTAKPVSVQFGELAFNSDPVPKVDTTALQQAVNSLSQPLVQSLWNPAVNDFPSPYANDDFSPSLTRLLTVLGFSMIFLGALFRRLARQPLPTAEAFAKRRDLSFVPVDK